MWEVRAETTATREVRLGLCVMRGERWQVRWVGERENKSKKEKSEKLAFPLICFSAPMRKILVRVKIQSSLKLWKFHCVFFPSFQLSTNVKCYMLLHFALRYLFPLMWKLVQSLLKFENCPYVYLYPQVFLHWCENPVVKCLFFSFY